MYNTQKMLEITALLNEEKKVTVSEYKGKSLTLLTDKGISVGDTIKISTSDNEFIAILMPRYESADENHIVVKLKSGYNIGIELSKIQFITKVEQWSYQNVSTNDSVLQIRRGGAEHDGWKTESRPRIALISTGGTIASRIDYRTGGVHAALSASDLYASIPELVKHASIDPEVILNEYSENLKPEHWTLIANKVNEKIRSGKYHGIIISHGTDTMHYTASALSFALQNLPIPVVLVGAQRSSDRPSSDAALNLIGATIFSVKSNYSGVFVAMHASSSDDIIACHIGTRVRKNHTSRRDAFESIDMMPVALVKGESVEMQPPQQQYVKLQERTNSGHNNFIVKSNFDSRVILLKYYPGFDPDLLSHSMMRSTYRAIILEGTGLGHINRECIPKIQKAVESGIMVFMTSQCIWGRTNMAVYDTGRDLLNIGVIPLSNMISETAIVKAMWVLANSKDR
ncbi:MAG TPA: Glu-tRNA(Gln) amidotransferase subunit GatD, partial [Nitrososphaeraceae archaeon]|nr:Glu-tRNA(Gln) amidotransferase subunit GatD [Nitrososphaeraceae archaeon]